MPVGPAEMTARLTIDPEAGDVATTAGFDAAKASGLAIDAGPGVTGLSGDTAAVLDALGRVIGAAVDAGARSIDIKIEVPESRPSGQ
jgi:hypothetical protein